LKVSSLSSSTDIACTHLRSSILAHFFHEAEKAILDDYIVELDPTRVISVREAANRLVGDTQGATIELYFEHALFGFNVAGASRELLEVLLESDDVLGIEEVR